MGGGTEPLIVRDERVDSCPEGYDGNGVITVNATWQQLKDAYDHGRPVYYQIGVDAMSTRFLLGNLMEADSNYQAQFYTVSINNNNRAVAVGLVLTAPTATTQLLSNSCLPK